MLQNDFNKGVQQTLKDLNHLYKNEKALHELQFSDQGFQWIDHTDAQNSVFAYVRKGREKEDSLVVIGNFTPQVIHGYEFGVPSAGTYEVVFNSDDTKYGGSGMKASAEEGAFSNPTPKHGFDQSIAVTLPPLGMVVLKLKA